MTEGFVFYPSYWAAMEKMPNEQRGIFISAMAQYWETGIDPDLDYPLNIAWELVKPNLDAHKKRKEQGAKGGKISKRSKANDDEISILKKENKGTYTDEISVLKKEDKDTCTETITEEEVEKEVEVDNIYIMPGKPALPYSDIIAYLNSKTGGHYQPNNKKTMGLIAARYKEGFTFDDFVTVIDKKYAEWHGTEFEQYLKPDTLFTTKFEGYLNQTIRPRPKPKSNNMTGRDVDYNAIAEGIMASQGGF